MTETHSSSPTVAGKHTVDTVAHAHASPEKSQPYAELGLTRDEYNSIVSLLGRRPSSSELAMYSVMWSEHCSYKSSKKFLRAFAENVTQEMTKNLMVGMGQNAGVVDIGQGWAVTFKIESHNHPSFIEPFQGAATGVGGIVRDIISMGARPVAVMDALRFGDPNDSDTERVAHGVISGISFYGNCLGLPNIGGETVFDAVYQKNPLVNALAVGVLRHDDLHLANASGAGNLVILFGARTGGDGIGGASILASETFTDGAEKKRPSVQVGDPFAEKVLIECCLELFEHKLVAGIQDLGAAGISCATSELAANGDGGMTIALEKTLLRDDTLSPEEILMSESQERMMAIVEPQHLEGFLAVTSKWDVETSVLGKVTDTSRLVITWHGEEIVNVDPKTVAHDGPVYSRAISRPDWIDELNASGVTDDMTRHTKDELKSHFLRLISSPNSSSTAWLTSQYDHYVQGNTALASPDDAGMIRVDEETGLGVSISIDGNARFCYLNPKLGSQLALAEAYRNVSATGAQPMAVSDCLNFGSPENPEVMWQLTQTIDGLSEGCKILGIPVTGGNVSLYNQTGDTPIHPTPVVAVLGVIDDVARRLPSGAQDEGHNLYILGTTFRELDGSSWAQTIHDHLGGVPPRVDFEAEKRLSAAIIAAAFEGLVDSAHDVSDGGLAVAIAESVLRFRMGARVWLSELCVRDSLDSLTALFSESTARMVVTVPREDDVKFLGLCAGRGVPVLRIGVTVDSMELEFQDLFTVSIDELAEAHSTVPLGSYAN